MSIKLAVIIVTLLTAVACGGSSPEDLVESLRAEGSLLPIDKSSTAFPVVTAPTTATASFYNYGVTSCMGTLKRDTVTGCPACRTYVASTSMVHPTPKGDCGSATAYVTVAIQNNPINVNSTDFHIPIDPLVVTSGDPIIVTDDTPRSSTHSCGWIWEEQVCTLKILGICIFNTCESRSFNTPPTTINFP